jgi:hypothetical protein
LARIQFYVFESFEKSLKPNLKVTHISDIQISPPDYVYHIVLESDGIATFVWLDFKLHSNIKAIFSDNGFVIFSNKKLIQFLDKIQFQSIN